MNPLALESRGWSRRRLIYAGLAIFVLQVAIVIWVGQRAQPAPKRPTFGSGISLVPDGRLRDRFDELTALEDPTLFALPNLKGFSGPAWLSFPSLDYQPQDYSEPINWLPLDSQELGATFSRFVATNAIPAPLVVDKPLPPLQRYEPHYPNEPVPVASRLRVEGELSARVPAAFPALRSWPHSQLLSNTTVQCVVDADGLTVSATLLSESGLKEADTDALRLAGGTRWRPLPGGSRRPAAADELAWGRLIFEWHTLPLQTTNAPEQP